jgi:hypothetical protein
MIADRVVDQIDVIIESFRHNGVVQYAPGYQCRMVNAVTPAMADEMLAPGDLVWVRGGFKPWLAFIDHCRKTSRWLMFYGANTGNERWPFWDIVLDDLSGKAPHIDGLSRLWLDYRKPVNPEIFKPVKTKPSFDLCIGASHIHDKKGQWRGVKAVRAYRERFGKNLRCILPGGLHRGVMTNGICAEIKSAGLDISMPGMVSRPELANIFNLSSVFCHLGSGGQGDRGPMEAMACGRSLIIGFPNYHANWISKSPNVLVPNNPDDFNEIADLIHSQIKMPSVCEKMAGHYSDQGGIDKNGLPMMRRICEFVQRHPVADRAVLVELLK